MQRLALADTGDGGEVGQRAATPAPPPTAHGLNDDAESLFDHAMHRDVESAPWLWWPSS